MKTKTYFIIIKKKETLMSSIETSGSDKPGGGMKTDQSEKLYSDSATQRI